MQPSVIDLPAEMHVGELFQYQLRAFVTRLAKRDGLTIPADMQMSMLLDLYGYELTKERLIERANSFLQGTTARALFARTPAYESFVQNQHDWVEHLFPDRHKKQRMSIFPRESTEPGEMLQDLTRSIQWDEPSGTFGLYGDTFVKQLLHNASLHDSLMRDLPELTRVMIPLVLDVIDIALSGFDTPNEEKLDVKTLQWLNDLFAWFETVLDWHQVALGQLSSLQRPD